MIISFCRTQKSITDGQGGKKQNQLVVARMQEKCNFCRHWNICDEYKNEKEHQGGKWKQPPCVIATLRNKTIPALKGKLLFLTGQTLSGSTRGRGCNAELVLCYQRSERHFGPPQKTWVQTGRRLQQEMTATLLGGLLSLLVCRMQWINPQRANIHFGW